MIQSHFVRLEPPYQVIFCNGEVGVQIGSLIVVEEKRGPNEEYGLLTHTHPVVNYGSKEILESRTKGLHGIGMYEGDFAQGAVWEKAEISDVLVIGLFGKDGPGALNENGFSDLVDRTLTSLIQQGRSLDHAINMLQRKLELIGMNPQYGTYKEMDVEMECISRHDVHYIAIHDAEYTIQMAIPFDTMPKMKEMVRSQARAYEQLFANHMGNTIWRFEYAWESLLSEMVDDNGRPIEEEHLISELAKELNGSNDSNS